MALSSLYLVVNWPFFTIYSWIEPHFCATAPILLIGFCLVSKLFKYYSHIRRVW